MWHWAMPVRSKHSLEGHGQRWITKHSSHSFHLKKLPKISRNYAKKSIIKLWKHFEASLFANCTNFQKFKRSTEIALTNKILKAK